MHTAPYQADLSCLSHLAVVSATPSGNGARVLATVAQPTCYLGPSRCHLPSAVASTLDRGFPFLGPSLRLRLTALNHYLT